MTIGQRDKVVQYLLSQITCMMMAKSPVKDEIRKAAQLHEGRLKAQLTKEEYEPIGVMRDTVDQLVKLLVNCESVDQLKQAHAYLQALNNGEVLIANENPDGSTELAPQTS
jgi:hypothetical protein